ncbi:HEAT repeat domain-containing protein [Streptomyces avidinii]|uniref:HEAT repeat protein n=1 Tax=Streptomyces avidinii TaxID=1895 RepID=A0ABS4L731_STRAV|nr:HEAT repeat domain-containing protein [Streptomyces avidinii]MBP2037878.1 hypothetical protein [Streptomyces avidinii]
MDGYRALTAWIESAWKELKELKDLDGSDAGRRDFCLDAVSDILETGRLTQDDAERAVERLVTVALSDEGHQVRESALHAVCTASARYLLPYRVVEPLAAGADGFEPLLLEYVLGVLGATHDQAALPVVERFLQHPRPDVRKEAADAVRELDGCRERSRLRAAAATGGRAGVSPVSLRVLPSRTRDCDPGRAARADPRTGPSEEQS